ncbi:TetR/AcrR family transcriptional regulator [Loktanella sp. M215]|uniref:TetR/AcrR family transcriptional regulator n=1 Tax=Loktanella sp. M215 TaxID=2675431 RepID=UPI001F2DFDEC|nr:TetR/AcrR family transcriptional regulator [Loktanella sp. M215]MCF7699115.1 TetR family transcriptional regulator [Loktanella sp. M215]
MRAEQRDATRDQIVQAALTSISESGYDGVSTRTIAARAGVTQGLLTYHFKSKDALWRAAADHLFTRLNAAMDAGIAGLPDPSPAAVRRETILQMVVFASQHPEMLRFIMDAGVSDSSCDWLVEAHLRRVYQRFCESHAETDRADLPHLFYILTGASVLIFSNASKCVQLSGMDPLTPEAVRRHADLVADLMEDRALLGT